MKTIITFIINLSISIFRLRNIVRLIQTSNISYYSYGMRELAIAKFHIETYDLVMFALFALYLVYNIWAKPELKGKAKNLHIVLQVIFHTLIFGLVIYECGLHGEYYKMLINLSIYLLVEAVVFILEYVHENKARRNEQAKPMK